ncbi:helix-turn-helix transcriptional regulator [Streptomyces sp. NPDC003077]|uniref:helix-turn-helix domain-containing protein n=1 Tax=Streptomyces sp. NPDC003077 TaxID=3154443 RepID=UPI0033A21432
MNPLSEPTRPADEEPGPGPEPELGRGLGRQESWGVLRAFGRQVKRFRMRAGLERTELGAMTGYSVSTIAAYEQGQRVPPPRFIDQVDEVVDAGGILKEMKEEVARAHYPAFFRDAARLEAEAVELHVYANQAVPGLLQTEKYARAVFGMWRPLLSEEMIDQRVTARLVRQEILMRRPMPTISFVIEEVTLRRPLGGVETLREQWEQILLVGQQRNVELQVMPTGREEHGALGGPFTLIETKEGRRFAYVEAHTDSRLHTTRSAVREFEEQYGILRAQGLTPQESLAFIERLLGEK